MGDVIVIKEKKSEESTDPPSVKTIFNAVTGEDCSSWKSLNTYQMTLQDNVKERCRGRKSLGFMDGDFWGYRFLLLPEGSRKCCKQDQRCHATLVEQTNS